MNLIPLTSIPKLSVVALCCVGVALPVMAAPPQTRLPETVRPTADFNRGISDKSAISSANQAFSASTQVVQRPHLDLRPPSAGEFGPATGEDGMPRDVTELGAMRHLSSDRGLGEDRETDNKGLNALHDEGIQAHPQGLAQGMAARFHREGLPVARLWENHAALVSLGFNQKGKPGLWLVQKTH